MIHVTSGHLKIAGLALLAIPMLILVVFAVSEVAGGDIWGLQHVVQLVPLALLAWLAWRQPLWGGLTLVVVALMLTGLYVIFMQGSPPTMLPFRVATLFLPPLLAGVLFVLAANQERRRSRRNKLKATPPTHS